MKGLQTEQNQFACNNGFDYPGRERIGINEECFSYWAFRCVDLGPGFMTRYGPISFVLANFASFVRSPADIQLMTPLQSLLLRRSISQARKYMILSVHFNRSLASIDTYVHAVHTMQSNPVSVDSALDPAKVIATKLSNCSNLQELNQIYANIIRTQMLESHSAPFHWNNIMRSYTRLEAPQKALHVFIAMLRAGVSPDCYTLPIILKVVCQLFAAGLDGQLHSMALKLGLQSHEYCESGFINLYGKSGNFENALQVFEENPDRKLGSWNAIISIFRHGARAREVIEMFMEMRRCGFEPDDVTMVGVTSACGSLGDLDLAYQLHKCVLQAKTFEKSDILMLNSLIDMYGKCGRMDLGRKVFSHMDERNVSSWTSMIVGYAMHGHVNEALECFRCMREAGVRPNNVTFIGLLSACVHGGTVQEGKYYFDMMNNVYGIKPQLQHYGCMVDLLGRAGLLEEARKMIEEMPMRANVVIWGCLMGACEKYGDVKMGEVVAKHLQELEPWNDGAHVVLSNIYASRGLWEEVERIRREMKQSDLEKIPGYSLATRSD
ncbi:pentatricopeptide repeat-containing protein [Tripterygium wilfordii]|uniref:Pentatricopeptide repeat-containing protein n=1 Tax=Tripterygium wilfordii TaxID=458696 RepID=A0A7J7D9H0_TRIWF|nr:pentatricopeptide repeat-containing protein At1g77170, mitochondrial [Tripterygium wilfordii]KAF5742997.1 pentatricopeptide repeat-containing protein [Tripterygium wilfordii]